MKTKFRLSTACLLTCAPAVSKEQTRYYLSGVYVEPVIDPNTGKGVRFVATDGHLMIVAYCRDSEVDAPMIVRMDLANKELKTTRKLPGPRFIGGEVERGKDATAEIRTFHDETLLGAMTVNQIDGDFPAYQKIIPSPFKMDPAAGHKPAPNFNPDLFARIAKGLGVMTQTKATQPLAISQTKDGEPMVVTSPEHEAAFAVLMPMRGEARDKPYWIDLPTKEEIEAAEAAE